MTAQNSLEKDRVVVLTDAAVSYLSNVLANQPAAKGIRLGVKKAGCSGFAYTLEVATEIAAGDTIIDWDTITVVIQGDHLSYLKGIQLDCVQEGLNRFLKFNNPNAAGECGCGESFSVDTPV